MHIILNDNDSQINFVSNHMGYSPIATAKQTNKTCFHNQREQQLWCLSEEPWALGCFGCRSLTIDIWYLMFNLLETKQAFVGMLEIMISANLLSFFFVVFQQVPWPPEPFWPHLQCACLSHCCCPCCFHLYSIWYCNYSCLYQHHAIAVEWTHQLNNLLWLFWKCGFLQAWISWGVQNERTQRRSHKACKFIWWCWNVLRLRLYLMRVSIWFFDDQEFQCSLGLVHLSLARYLNMVLQASWLLFQRKNLVMKVSKLFLVFSSVTMSMVDVMISKWS